MPKSVNRPNIDTPQGCSWLAAHALQGYAEGLRRQARSRSYAGPRLAEHRANLRAWAKDADTLADRLRSGRMTVDDTFAGSE